MGSKFAGVTYLLIAANILVYFTTIYNQTISNQARKDGVFVVELLMACYMASEKNRKLSFPPARLEDFVPKVVQGT